MQKKIHQDMFQAMKDKDELKKETLRLIFSEIKKQAIDTKKELTDDEIIKILKTNIKKRHDAIELFLKGGRDELVEKTQLEIKIIEAYLPKQLSKDELEKIVASAIEESGAKEPKDMGKVMKVVMQKYGSQTNGKAVQQIASEKLKPQQE